MNARVIRKGLGIFIVDIAIIIGIFVLQFRTDSNIIEKIGNLQVTFTKSEANYEKKSASDSQKTSQSTENSENEEPEFTLKNKMLVSYNGANFYFDEQTPPYILFSGQEEKTVAELKSWEKSEKELKVSFTQNINLYFTLNELKEDSPLIVYAELPRSVQNFYLPYNFAYTMKVQKDEGKKVLLSNKKQIWDFSTDQIENGYIVFNHRATMANYSIHNEEKKFTFDDLTQLASAEGINYLNVINNLKSSLISSFKASLSDNSYSEQAVVSYVAAMSENAKYQQAIDDIPQTFKRSEQRTYLSAPYFNNLVNMNNVLEQKLKADSSNIAKAVYSDSLDIFTVHNLAFQLCIYPSKADVIKILQRAVDADIQNCAISQVTGIIQTFIDLYSMNTDYAKILSPVMEQCIEKITSACKFENNILTISENDTFLSVTQAVEVGIAILRFGEIRNNDTYIRAGRVIITSYIAESSSFDLRTLANLYPLIAYDNWYYPHFKIIRNESNQFIWAWTCAQDINWARETDGSLTLKIKFPLELTHYVIFKGIPEFTSIYIYNMAFRTDPRFETYNSSGYVYRSTSDTLLLKSRHKSEIENITMGYKAPAAKTTTTTPTPAATTTPTETPAATSSTETTTTGTQPATTATTTTTTTTATTTSPTAATTTTTTPTAPATGTTPAATQPAVN